MAYVDPRQMDNSGNSAIEPWDRQKPYLMDIYDTANRLSMQSPVQYYPGQTFAGRDPLQDQAQNLGLNYATSSMPGQIYDAQRAQSFALNSPDVANNPYVQNMMESNAFMANRNLAENVLPQLKLGAMASGQVGSSRHRGIAEGLAARGTNEALANANAQTMMDAYGKGLTAQQGSLGMSPGLMKMGMEPMNVMSQVGAYNRGIDQEALGSDIQRWDKNQMLPWENLQRYNSFLAGSPMGSEAASGGSSPLGTALGIGSMATGLFGGGAASPFAGITGALGGLFGGGGGLGGLGGSASQWSSSYNNPNAFAMNQLWS